MNKYLDATGLATLWAKIKKTFVQIEEGKGLSTNDYDDAAVAEVAKIANKAESSSINDIEGYDTLSGVEVREVYDSQVPKDDSSEFEEAFGVMTVHYYINSTSNYYSWKNAFTGSFIIPYSGYSVFYSTFDKAGNESYHKVSALASGTNKITASTSGYNIYVVFAEGTSEEVYSNSVFAHFLGKLDNKQDTLVSGTNIKTVNNNSLLGSGNISINSGISDVKVDGTSVVSNGVAAIDLSGKVDKVDGKGLSTNDYDDSAVAEVAKVAEKANKSDLQAINNNGYEYVDLGLPSGLLWATCNIGAKSATEYGNYFAWGETVAKKSFTLDNYTASALSSDLTLDEDAAHVNMGGDWRMPTKEELQELLDNTTLSWNTNSRYCVLTSKVDSSKSIIIPLAGNDASYSEAQAALYLWSSSFVDSSQAYNCVGRFLTSINASSLDRYHGLSIRGVISFSDKYALKSHTHTTSEVSGIGTLSSLTTTAKDSLTDAINELVTRIEALENK